MDSNLGAILTLTAWLWAVTFVKISSHSQRKPRFKEIFNRWGIKMTKSELILKLADANPHLYQRDIETLVATVFEEITHALEDGNRVELRGFGAFSTKQREARTGRNPRTGDSVEVTEKNIPFFKAGKQLREKLNP